jgi:hypothetical protein
MADYEFSARLNDQQVLAALKKLMNQLKRLLKW